MEKQRIIEAMRMVAEDTKNDARDFDGKPFNGKTMAEYMGNHGAAIDAVAKAIISILESKDTQDESGSDERS